MLADFSASLAPAIRTFAPLRGRRCLRGGLFVDSRTDGLSKERACVRTAQAAKFSHDREGDCAEDRARIAGCSLDEIADRNEFLAAVQKGIDQLDCGEGPSSRRDQETVVLMAYKLIWSPASQLPTSTCTTFYPLFNETAVSTYSALRPEGSGIQ